ncbi:glycine N-methyltransferase-like isoform X2 [Lytechinus variegatus]|uniref:glycine N-methyltransferase-like isoform X2 n=2 Tax=Lytechinus variegatus TaxID=7654 RepID=UPI001BB2505F|nr:glycine N-methyltransferase-like isoform X2 [Lytechinus variegatus]
MLIVYTKMQDISNPFDDSDAVHKLGPLAERSSKYNQWLLGVLQRKNCRRILDAACGTGVDSLFLLKHGMEVVSCDDAEAMLFYARSEKERLGLKDWEVKRANWLTLDKDLEGHGQFDAVLCLGSSILHLVDRPPELKLHRQCLNNFQKFLKPGGLLLIDHRNIDSMMDRGIVVNKNVYHKEDTLPGVSTKTITVDGVPTQVDIIYDMLMKDGDTGNNGFNKIEKVTMPLAPVHVHKFTALLKDVFGGNCTYTLYGDLEEVNNGNTENIAYFQHVVHE